MGSDGSGEPRLCGPVARIPERSQSWCMATSRVRQARPDLGSCPSGHIASPCATSRPRPTTAATMAFALQGQVPAQSAPVTLTPHTVGGRLCTRERRPHVVTGTGSEGPGEDGAPQVPGEEGGPKKSTRGRKRRTEPVKVVLESGETALLSPKEYRSHRRQGPQVMVLCRLLSWV